MLSLILSIIALTLSGISAAAAIFSARASTKSARAAEASVAANQANFKESTELTKRIFEQNSALTKDMFRRQGVISLHTAWQDVSGINPAAPVVPDIVRAVNTLGLTAALWNHDVVDKEILYQQYWKTFESLHDTLLQITKAIPGIEKSGRDLVLTPDITAAYEGMKERERSGVRISQV